MLSLDQQARAARAFVDTALVAAGGADATLAHRLDTHFPRLYELYTSVYGDRADCLERLADLVLLAARVTAERSEELRALDASREADPTWYLSNRMLGGVCYVDRYAGDLAGLREQIPYFKELGLTYPAPDATVRAPEGNSDGGYAVSSYRDVNPELGTMEELRALAAELQQAGISLVLDFVFNHTSDEHEWAQRALAGEPEYEEFYRIFPDRTMPDTYERTTTGDLPRRPSGLVRPAGRRPLGLVDLLLVPVGPQLREPRGVQRDGGGDALPRELGVEVLRMDAVAFIWKRSAPRARTCHRPTC